MRSSTMAKLLHRRWLVRAPIALYRARLGFLFGRRLLLLEHTGRTTGARRYVVLEVVDRRRDGYVVASGFGERAQWYRNLRANPHARVTIGWHGPRPAVASRLDPDRARATLRDYAARHPRAWRKLRPVFEETLGATIDESGTSLPLVALDLSRGRAGD